MSVKNASDLFYTFEEVVQHRSKLKRVDRGLPDEKSRKDLARTYLEVQNKLWPELSGTGILPPVSELAIEQYADSMRDNFVNGVIGVFIKPLFLVLAIAAAYVRYSCDNSNPRSLAQQLLNILEGAKRFGYFIPWQFVFADAAISGTTSDRRGYQLSKELIRHPTAPFECLLVDEIGRANRDMIESLMLGRLVMYFKKRMVGVTDGLDSRQPQFHFNLAIFSCSTRCSYFNYEIK